MTYNPEKAISSLHAENLRTHNLIHLGNKGFNLVVLTRDRMPVPPAFIIYHRCSAATGRSVSSSGRETNTCGGCGLRSSLEQLTGLVFIAPDRPLLLSVRSGAAISMPGIMSTIHNVGANEEMVEEFVTLHPEKIFASDNFRRFQQSWGMAHGMEREDFQELMNTHKLQHHVHYKRDFSPGRCGSWRSTISRRSRAGVRHARGSLVAAGWRGRHGVR